MHARLIVCTHAKLLRGRAPRENGFRLLCVSRVSTTSEFVQCSKAWGLRNAWKMHRFLDQLESVAPFPRVVKISDRVFRTHYVRRYACLLELASLVRDPPRRICHFGGSAIGQCLDCAAFPRLFKISVRLFRTHYVPYCACVCAEFVLSFSSGYASVRACLFELASLVRDTPRRICHFDGSTMEQSWNVQRCLNCLEQAMDSILGKF